MSCSEGHNPCGTTSAEDLKKKQQKVRFNIVYSNSRDQEHIRHITFVQKTVV